MNQVVVMLEIHLVITQMWRKDYLESKGTWNMWCNYNIVGCEVYLNLSLKG